MRSGCLLEARSHRKPLNGRELRSAVGRLVIDGWDESERDCVVCVSRILKSRTESGESRERSCTAAPPELHMEHMRLEY